MDIAREHRYRLSVVSFFFFFFLFCPRRSKTREGFLDTRELVLEPAINSSFPRLDNYQSKIGTRSTDRWIDRSIDRWLARSIDRARSGPGDRDRSSRILQLAILSRQRAVRQSTDEGPRVEASLTDLTSLCLSFSPPTRRAGGAFLR